MQLKHLNQKELARRWTLSHRTLERWRRVAEGPRFLKLGGRVVYRLEDILAFEADRQRQGTARDAWGSSARPRAGGGTISGRHE